MSARKEMSWRSVIPALRPNTGMSITTPAYRKLPPPEPLRSHRPAAGGGAYVLEPGADAGPAAVVPSR